VIQLFNEFAVADSLQGTYSMSVSTWSSKLFPEFPVREPFRDERFLFNLKVGSTLCLGPTNIIDTKCLMASDRN